MPTVRERERERENVRLDRFDRIDWSTWKDDAGDGHGNGHLPIGFDLCQVEFQAEEEHEEDQTEIGDQREDLQTRLGPNGFRPSRSITCPNNELVSIANEWKRAIVLPRMEGPKMIPAMICPITCG